MYIFLFIQVLFHQIYQQQQKVLFHQSIYVYGLSMAVGFIRTALKSSEEHASDQLLLLLFDNTVEDSN